jgi:hypothetical protein
MMRRMSSAEIVVVCAVGVNTAAAAVVSNHRQQVACE